MLTDEEMKLIATLAEANEQLISSHWMLVSILHDKCFPEIDDDDNQIMRMQ